MIAIVLYVNNTTCIVQLKDTYIKGDRIKHISPKFLFTHGLQKNDDINIQQVRLSDNLANCLPRHFRLQYLKS